MTESAMSEKRLRSTVDPKTVLAGSMICDKCCTRLFDSQSSSSSTDNATTVEGSCPVCFGIISLLDEATSKACDALTAVQAQEPLADYDIAILAPMTAELREFRALKACDSSTPATTVLSLKDVVRNHLMDRIGQKMGLQRSIESNIRLTVSFTHQSAVDSDVSEVKSFAATAIKYPVRSADAVKAVISGLTKLTPSDLESVFSPQPLLPPPLTASATVDIRVERGKVHVAGRYLKLGRNVSQTPWFVDGERLAPTSVSEEIERHLLPVFGSGTEGTFTAAGREDADVKMLGKGRPFYIVISNPDVSTVSQQVLDKVACDINANSEFVRVNGLWMMDSSHTNIIKEGEQSKRKHYSALVWTSEPLTQEHLNRLEQYQSKQLEIAQETPIRVLQRRAPLNRPKTIYSMTVQKHPDHEQLAIVDLVTEAGTYIKEFIHGDLGRTEPSFRTLAGVKVADILALDVQAVELEWPPSSP